MQNVEALPTSERQSSFLARLAQKIGNRVLAHSIEHDTAIDLFQSKIAKDFTDDTFDMHDYDDEVHAISLSIAKTLNNTEAIGTSNWNDYFRLLNHYTFLEQRLFAPLMFSDHRHYRQREELINGSYGMYASLLEIAMNMYDKSNHSSQQKKELTGVITELTALSVTSRLEKPSELALLSSTHDDHMKKHDIDYLYIPKREPMHLAIQVKTATPTLPIHFPHSTKNTPFYVYAKDFDNLPTPESHFPTSKRIIEEVMGTISDDDRTILDNTYTKFMTMIHDAARSANSR